MNDGGSAFPYVFKNFIVEFEKGMTLRDYFAAKAMGGLIARSSNGLPHEAWVCKEAYKHADAMLKARETTNARQD